MAVSKVSEPLNLRVNVKMNPVTKAFQYMSFCAAAFRASRRICSHGGDYQYTVV